MTRCPSTLELDRYLGDPRQAPRVGEHVARCRECEAALERMAANNRLLDEVKLLETTTDDPRRLEGASDLPRLDGYRLVRECDRGGQGTVYEAVQLSTNRTVAVKLSNRPSPEGESRFQREIELAAGLDHPCVVRLFDSATTASGRRFFVMEFVDGVPLGAVGVKGEVPLPRRELLALFHRICDAVNHAHQRGVIHRDLKPSNILVDREGAPHVLDFGVAKPTRVDPEHDALHTEPGLFLGTLAYASPEQVGAGSGGVDVRSDVYALGVIFYELLVGHLPYRVDESIADVVQAILKAEPLPPGRSLDADLTTLLQKALAKDPARRYPSAGALGRDIQRYLDGLPIDARGDSTWYVITKTLGRHRLPVAMSAVVLLAIVVAGIVASLAWRRADREAVIAAREATTSRRVIDSMKNMFRLQEPARALGATLTVKSALDRAAAGGWSDLEGEPLVRAELLQTTGEVYASLGLYPEALRLLERALELRREQLGDDDPATLESLGHVGLSYLHERQLEPAEAALVPAAEGLARVLGRDDPRTLEALVNTAALRHAQGDFDGAERLYAEVLAARRRQLGDDDPATVNVLNNLALLQDSRGQYESARELLEEVVATLRRALPEDHPRTLTAIHNLGLLAQRNGQHAEAERLYREALEGRRRVLPPTHEDTLASLNGLGTLSYRMGNFEEAAARLGEALALTEAALGPEHYHTITTANNLGTTLQRLGRLDEAEPLLRRAVMWRKRELGPADPATLRALGNLAGVLLARGQGEDAERLRLEALESAREVLGPDHPQTLRAEQNLGELYLTLQRPQDAEPHLLAAVDGRRRALRPGHPDTLRSLVTVIRHFRSQKQLEQAESLAVELLGLLDADHPQRAAAADLLEQVRAERRGH